MIDIEAIADELQGNWQKFESFFWHNEPEENSGDYGHIVLRSRDSGLLTRVNAETIEEIFEDEDDAWTERHSHWGPGWLDVLVIRVRKDGIITPVFEKYFDDVYAPLRAYPVLDEERFSQAEYDAWTECVETESDLVKPQAIYTWIKDNHSEWLDYDNDPYLSNEQIQEAISALLRDGEIELVENLEDALFFSKR